MRGCFFISLILGCVLSVNAAHCQTTPLNTFRTKTIPGPETARQALDSFIIFPQSVKITEKNGQLIDSSTYVIAGRFLIWKKQPELSRFPLTIQYRISPYFLQQKKRHLDSSRLAVSDELAMITNPYRFENSQGALEIRGLNSSGSFARSLAFGNNQDLVLNSRFNLQLAGTIGDVSMNAAITDENIPIQPEGNTQDLREFDKIFIELKKDDTKLIAGDYELGRPNSYFINYFKKLQGVSLFNATELSPDLQQRSNVSLAISGGNFARNQIQQQEGNQGPYQLNGANNERFIIIRSGTEKVWIDGRPLVRGIDEDYIIDYNRSEITFTNKNLITKDSRIVVEFEYSDQQFLSTVLAANSSWTYQNFDLNFSFFSQQDSRAPSRTLQLTDAERAALQAAGDDFQSFSFLAVDTLDDINSTMVSYFAVDTSNSCVDTIEQIFVVNSGNKSLQALDVQFTFVGDGNGNYVIDNSTVANETVFKWVAPDPSTCRPRGNYSPIRPLVAPRQQAMTAINGSWHLSENSTIGFESAWSTRDLNRFSELDSEDNNGMAFTVSWQNNPGTNKKENPEGLQSSFLYEYKDQFFQPINPYRRPEFFRDWSIADKQNIGTINPANEHLLSGSLKWLDTQKGQIGLQLSYFNRQHFYDGFRQVLNANWETKAWRFQTNSSYLTATSQKEKRRFLRPNLIISKTIGKQNPWIASLSGEAERNERRNGQQDTLTLNSFGFDVFKFTLRSPENKDQSIEVSATQRRDFEPTGTIFSRQTLAQELNINGESKLGRGGFIRGNFNYRNLQVERTENLNTSSGETFLGRLDNRLTFFKGALRTSTTYELGSGQEPRRAFTFVRVARGEGTHVWLDSLYNNDGIIQANEMEIAPFPDQANFVKVSTISNEFIRTDYVTYNQSLNVSPKAVWYNKKGIRGLLKRFALQSNLRISRKTQKGADVAIWNPFELALQDSNLISINSGIRNLLFFNRGNPDFDTQLGWVENRNKFLQTTGFESRSQREQFAKVRWNFTNNMGIESEVNVSNAITLSELATNRNFELDKLGASLQLNYFFNDQFRVSGSYSWSQTDNVAQQSEMAFSTNQELKLSGTYSEAARMTVRLEVSYVDVNFMGQANSPVGFAILNGLQKGQNILWQLNMDRRLSGSLQMSVGYEGRKTGQARTIHVGRAQITALF